MKLLIFNRINLYKRIGVFLFATLLNFSCSKDNSLPQVDPSDNLAIDSIRATKTSIVVWEKIFVTAYTRGENLTFKWKSNHGSLVAKDTSTVKYWACPSCEGLNIIECEVSNAFGMVKDTIMIHVLP